MVFADPSDNLPSDSRRTLEQMIENSHEGIAIIGSDYRIDYANDNICEIFGRPREEVLGKNFMTFVHRDSSYAVLDRYVKLLQGVPIVESLEARVLHAESGPRDVQMRASILRTNTDDVKILTQVLDVTEDKQTRQTLSEREAIFCTLVNIINEGLGIIDDKGAVVYANAALCKMIGSPADELVGKTAGDIMQGLDLDSVFEKIKSRIAGRSDRYETRLVHASGKLIPVMVSASPVLCESGEYIGSCAVFTDITEQKMAKKELENARDRAVLYLDLMRHDIRNYLQEVQFAAEIIELKTSDSTLREMAASIREAVMRSTRIISDSRTIEQIEGVPLQERSLDEVLHEMMKNASILLEDVQISLSLHVTGARVQADEYLEVMLSDLLTFAYNRSREDIRRIWIDLREVKNVYELSISDDGPELPQDLIENLLDHRLRLGGVSLHLANHIIRKYGGAIELINEVRDDRGRRTTIRLTLPRGT